MPRKWQFDDIVRDGGIRASVSPEIREILQSEGISAIDVDGPRLTSEALERLRELIGSGGIEALVAPSCGVAGRSRTPWIFDEPGSGSHLSIKAWGAPQGRWDRRSISWSFDAKDAPASAQQALADAFASWGNAALWVTGGTPIFTFRQVGSGGDIRIRFAGPEYDDRFGAAGGVLASAGYPDTNRKGSMGFDRSEQWTLDSLRRTAIHEIGHSLGLAHSTVKTSVMYPNLQNIVGVDAETMWAIALMYGLPPQEVLADRASAAGPALLAGRRRSYIDGTSDPELVYGAWRGTKDDRRLYTSVWDGSWGAQSAGPGASETGPALARHGDRLWMAWRGIGDDSRIYLSSSAEGPTTAWSAQAPIAGRGTSARPALASFDGQLWMAWKGVGSDSAIWVSSAANPHGAWSTPYAVYGVGTSHGPSLAVFQNELWMAWRGIGNDATIWLSRKPVGDVWLPQQQLVWSAVTAQGRKHERPGTAADPTIFAEGTTRLWAIWRGTGSDQSLWFSYFDPTEGVWAGQMRMFGGSAASPGGVATSRGRMFLWRGINDDRRLYTGRF
ncbi:matrixin family metalloprotease [Microbacterium oxydans]|uniref:matrixin family metalloprotease n=1 Tax=Microbacterium oxydans TaxID=82380 RepID=UPI0007340401|nr:matrixin family metalloprotease [Microbacterium oxydans]